MLLLLLLGVGEGGVALADMGLACWEVGKRRTRTVNERPKVKVGSPQERPPAPSGRPVSRGLLTQCHRSDNFDESVILLIGQHKSDLTLRNTCPTWCPRPSPSDPAHAIRPPETPPHLALASGLPRSIRIFLGLPDGLGPLLDVHHHRIQALQELGSVFLALLGLLPPGAARTCTHCCPTRGCRRLAGCRASTAFQELRLRG